MKLIVRTITLMVISIVMIFISVYLVNVNIITDEINKVSYIAMSCVQNDVMNLIKKRDLNGETYLYDYDERFKYYFKNLATKYEIYDINTYGDSQKGIIYVEVNSNVNLVKGKRLINIVDQIVSTQSGNYKDQIDNSLWWEPKKNQTLYTWDIPYPYQVKSWHIDIDAMDLGTGAYYKYYEPAMTLTCEYDGSSTVLGTTPGRNGRQESMEINLVGSAKDQEIGCKCKKVILTSVAIPRQFPRIDYMTIGNTKDTSITYTANSKKVTSYSRYIDERKILDENSIWLSEDYKETLDEILGIYNERNN